MTAPRRRPLAAFVAIALLPVIAACTSSGGAPGSSEDDSIELPGTFWMLVELGGSAPAGDAKPTLVFGADGSVSGNSGCNTFNGPVTIDGSTLGFGPLATTRMACPEPAMSVESAYLAGLDGASTWRMDGSQLVLEGATTLTFDPA